MDDHEEVRVPESSLQGSPDIQRTVRSSRAPRSRARRIVAVAIVLLIVAFLGASLVSVPYEAITPGSTLNVASLITVPPAHRHVHSGSISMVDVNLVSLNAISYLADRLNHDDQVLSTTQVVGSESSSAYNEQGVLDMVSAQQAATYVAFRQLGWPVTLKFGGLVVYATEPGSPAQPSSGIAPLLPGDELHKINGRLLSSVTSLQTQLRTLKPGSSVSLSISRPRSSAPHVSELRLGEIITQNGVTRCRPVTRSSGASGRPCIGVQLEVVATPTNLPFPVDLNAEGIIGPSAGLAFTLGLMNAIDTGSLTGGLRIAATGTMSTDGAVGDVGGVAQKTIAVRRAGAQLFFVPTAELAVARANAGPTMSVYGVSSITTVLQILEQHGGVIVKEFAR
jgi:PDZ domain-containing protein